MSAASSRSIRSRCAPGCPAISSAIHFTDGQMVKKGDLLFTIDRRPFQIALDQMRANLAQARANLAFTEADLARGQELLHNKTITEQTFDQRTQAKRVAEASVAAQRGHGAFGRARSRQYHRTARADRRPHRRPPRRRSAIWSPAAPAATPRCSPPSSRSIRSASSSPSTRRRICATSASPKQRQRHRRRATAACRSRSS